MSCEELKPTWEILEFEQGIQQKNFRKAIWLSRTLEGKISVVVIGNCLVFRKWKQNWELDEDNYMLEPVNSFDEVARYVFYEDKIYMETKDKIRSICTLDKVMNDRSTNLSEDSHDLLDQKIYWDFVQDVNIVKKEKMIKAFSLLGSNVQKFDWWVFRTIYYKLVKKTEIEESVPDDIIYDLLHRKYVLNSAIRLKKDLVVVTLQVVGEYFDEETRCYLKKEEGYFFRKNAVLEKWESIDVSNLWLQKTYEIGKDGGVGTILGRYYTFTNLRLQEDIFEGTYLEKYTKYKYVRRVWDNSLIDYTILLMHAHCLCVEQASNVGEKLFKYVKDNVCCGNIENRKASLPEIFGVTGKQLKFLETIHLPSEIQEFKKLINDVDVKEHFPDIKKRVYAVSLYLTNCNNMLSKEELLKAANTLYTLEKKDISVRKQLSREYMDYLVMCKRYDMAMEGITPEHPLYPAIVSFGKPSVNIKPSRISDCHRKLSIQLSVLWQAKEIEQYTQAITEIKEKEASKYEYTNGKYSILMPKDVLEIVQEGSNLQHCVGSAGYIGLMAAGECTILFLRENKNIDKSFFTIEVSKRSIVQCYGMKNRLNEDIEVRNFIEEYAKKRNLIIDTEIYVTN